MRGLPNKTNKSCPATPFRKKVVSGDCWREVSQSGQLRYADLDMLLNNAANVNVRKHREAYAAPDRLLNLSFTPFEPSGSKVFVTKL